MFEGAGAWIDQPIDLLMRSLHRVADQGYDVAFLLAPETCETGMTTPQRKSSNGTVEFETGTLQWWHIVLHSAGIVIKEVLRTEADCMLQGSAISSGNCTRHVCADHKVPDCLAPAVSQFMKREFGPRFGPTPTHRSCAVVMNGGIITGIASPMLGPLIDSHPFVIRLNGAEIGEKFAPFAGSKLTLRLGSSSVERSTDFANVSHMPKSLRMCFGGCVQVAPTTGLVATALALQICDRVVVFGKAHRFRELQKEFPYHYYEKGSYQGKNHDWDFEDSIFSVLITAGCVQSVT